MALAWSFPGAVGGLEAQAVAYFVAPEGRPENAGTPESPWDLASALGGGHEIEPGATLFLRGGVYRRRPQEMFEVRLSGAEEKPIHVRPLRGERVTIDGGLQVVEPTAHVWIWDLEIMVSEPNPVEPTEPGSSPVSFTRPNGGVNVLGSRNNKFINLVVHHCRGGFGFWSGHVNGEIYGCLIYDNGWWGQDRGHGHAVYTQNQEGTKVIADCIMTGGYSYTMHAYGSERAYVDHFLIEGNIAYDGGPFLVGGGRPSQDIQVCHNYLYNVPMRIGYAAPENHDCLLRDNVIVHANLEVKNYRSGEVRDNLLVDGQVDLPGSENLTVEGNRTLPLDSLRQEGPLIVLRPNKYDPNRAHLAIFNWGRALAVQVDGAGFLRDGERFVLKDPKHFFGDPVHWGVCEKGKIMVPLFQREFAAFVLLKKAEWEK